MFDRTAHRTVEWRSWHIFAYAFVIYLLAIVAIVHQGMATQVSGNEIFGAALLAAIAVAGVGYQEVRETLGAQLTSRTHFTDDEW